MYFIVNSGRKIELDSFTADDINLKDIAHHLTKTCRYSGALPLDVHYSVAAHCINLYYYCIDKGLSLEHQRYALMHDAVETYLGDINSIVKRVLPDFTVLEYRINEVLLDKYCLTADKNIIRAVDKLDKRIVLDEAKALFPKYYKEFVSQYSELEPLGLSIQHDSGYAKHITKAMFLHCCNQADIHD